MLKRLTQSIRTYAKAQSKVLKESDSVDTVISLSRSLNLPQDEIEEITAESITLDKPLRTELVSYIKIKYGSDDVFKVKNDICRGEISDKSRLPLRPPVITIMGHVDHGKTSLLDYMRHANVAKGEAGGITQHIGAFKVKFESGREATFLDTPGHAAFAEMRYRGSLVTDIIVLVVAVNDGIQEQTVESIRHALEAKVPIIVAINKMDKSPGNDCRKIKSDLMNYGIHVEDMGGDTQAIPISALTGFGMKELEDAIFALAEILDLRSDPKSKVEGVVIESKLDSFRGVMSTILIQAGTLTVGKYLLAGTSVAKVKAMISSAGVSLKQAGPSTPVEIVGFDDLPFVGSVALEANSEKHAISVAEERKRVEDQRQNFIKFEESLKERFLILNDPQLKARHDQLLGRHMKKRYMKKDAALTMEMIGKNSQWDQSTVRGNVIDVGQNSLGLVPTSISALPKLNLVVKADVIGSLEALEKALSEIPTVKCRLQIIRKAIGSPTEDDLNFAAITKAAIVCFNVNIQKKLEAQIEAEKLNVSTFTVIYHLLEKVELEMRRLLPNEYDEILVGAADLVKVFDISIKKKATKPFAGCTVTKGKLFKNDKHIYVIKREGEIIHRGKLYQLKHFKVDVESLQNGQDCILDFGSFDEFKEKDVIECYELVERLPKLV